MIIESVFIFLYAITVFLILVTYLLYPFLLKGLFRGKSVEGSRYSTGTVYIIIPAYNEESVVEDKILNTLANMGSKSQIVVVSDSSNDMTDSICQKLATKNDNVSFYINLERGGKNKCLNLAVQEINPEQNDILIFTDCNTFFDENSIPEIIKTLTEGASLAAGSMVYQSKQSESAVSEGLYWHYEEWIRKMESESGSLIVCNGGLFGMWADCYKQLPAFVPNDFEAPLRLNSEGKYVVMNPEAKGLETAIDSSKEEYSRKKRQANRQMNCIIYLWKDLDFGTKYQVLFHKFLRWFGLHLFVIASVLSYLMFLFSNHIIIEFIFYSHLFIIVIILFSLINRHLNFDSKFLPKILHAINVHKYSSRGVIEALKGRKQATWEKAISNR